MDFNTLLQYYPGYQGWDPTAAMADFNKTGGAGKGGGMGMGAGGVPTFSFDYEAEAKKAYGELGEYYDRLLKESKGDLNLALSRMVEDYDTGLRFKKEDLSTAQDSLSLAQQEADRQAALGRDRLKESALARGIYQKSAMDPNGGLGIADTELSEYNTGVGYSNTLRKNQGQGLLTAFNRYKETADVNRKRTEFDLPEKQKRYEFGLEQERRAKSGELANLRGERAYQKFYAGSGSV